MHLRENTKLEWLNLSDTRISDAGLARLSLLTNLKLLYLNDTSVSDAGLVHLRGLTHLQRLYLDGTQVTDAGCNALQQALPNCRIDR